MAIITHTSVNEKGATVLSLSNPANGEPLYDICCQSADEVAQAVAKARAAQTDWAKLSIKQRVSLFLKLRDVILDNQQRILDTVIAETGKPQQDALTFEVFAVCSFISYWCKQAPKTLKQESMRAAGILGLAKKITTVYKPLGVVGVIAPWNGPFVLTANPCIQAMMAGNTVVAKGSEVTPKSAKLLEAFCLEAGFPEGVCQVLIGDGKTGAALTASDVDKIAFTGSVNTGKHVAAACIDRLIPYSLELGGKDAMIVLNDADVELAAHAAVWGSCVNTGHFCCGTERIYVEAGIYDAFVAKVVKLAKALRQGKQHGVNEDLGAVFWDRQLEIMQRHVDDAISKGATVLVGGKANTEKGTYFEATVLTDVDESSSLITEETFGPVMPIIKVNSVDEAIAKANNSNYGLHGSVWTKDVNKGLAIAKQIQTGSMAVNDIGMMYGVANATFGGVKESGVGHINGRYGLRSYTHAMPIISGIYRGEDSGYPHDINKFKRMQKLMQFMWKNKIGRLLFGP